MVKLCISSLASVRAAIRSPIAPWQALQVREAEGGYLSIYYSDDLSPLAVRAITKPGDHKSDPNLETSTYGLFSTCSPSMRAGVRNSGVQCVFFGTRRDAGRALAGYMHFRWFTSAVSPRPNDFSLAADAIRFIHPAIPFPEVDRRCRTEISRRFRCMLRLTAKEAERIRDLVDGRHDATADYLSEIDRLERLNLLHTGYRYPTWQRVDGFSWDAAREYLAADASVPAAVSGNSSETGWWECVSCGGKFMNKALLRRCPKCGKLGSLKPAKELK